MSNAGNENGLQRLEVIRKLNGENREWGNSELYRLMYKQDLYILAYERIKSHPGNMTPGTDDETLDRFSLAMIDELIQEMRTETNRSELLQRVYADKCELCGSTERVEVHHVRKLADLEKAGRKEKPVWMKQMLIRRRKTLVVCRQCHEAIHAGRPTAPFRRKGTGEPRDAKVSRGVREGGNGKGP